ncbi:NAD-dependent dehydratase [Marmoricola endophyticus]|uniref:NAD-dependent dehydratase n=1 Tax=Marmoricola endophyticus TaxID=2040280 RepID=A0A917BCH4_9ACTN|nr:SDR family oxidoreductase [Marmoricola endophyticus]GGF37389.1 NAD-dependent dehydratase [Marmoricola endophyticus]
MRVTIAGGHGQIAQHLERRLSRAGHEVVAMIRKPEQAGDVEANGASTVLIDLESTDVEEMARAIDGSDAVVFAAGGGGDGNKERKETVDKGAAIMLADAAEQAGVNRYLMVSAMGTDQIDPDSDEVFQVYLRAKLAADEDLQKRDLAWTIVRPGKLTDDPGTGLVQVGSLGRGEVPRDDVAAVLVAALDSTKTVGKTFDLLGGENEIEEAFRTL